MSEALVTNWLRATENPEVVERLLPEFATQAANQWNSCPVVEVSFALAQAMRKRDYHLLLQLIPKMHEPESLALYAHHSSIQVRRLVAQNAATSDTDRMFLLEWAIKADDPETIEAVAPYLPLALLDELYEDRIPGHRSVLAGPRAGASLTEPDARERVLSFLATYSPTGTNGRVLTTYAHAVVNGLVDVTPTEFVETIPGDGDGRLRITAAELLMQVTPELSVELIEIALRYLDHAAPSLVRLGYRGILRSTSAISPEALVVLGERAGGYLLRSISTCVATTSSSDDAIAALTKHALSDDSVDPEEMFRALCSVFHSEQISLTSRDLIGRTLATLVRAAPLTPGYMKASSTEVANHLRTACTSSTRTLSPNQGISPSVIHELQVPLLLTEDRVFSEWVNGNLTPTRPSFDDVKSVIDEVCTYHGGAAQLSSQLGDVAYSVNPANADVLDYAIEATGPLGINDSRPFARQRVFERLDCASRGFPETAASLAALLKSGWESSLSELIETARLLSGREPGDDCVPPRGQLPLL